MASKELFDRIFSQQLLSPKSSLHSSPDTLDQPLRNEISLAALFLHESISKSSPYICLECEPISSIHEMVHGIAPIHRDRTESMVPRVDGRRCVTWNLFMCVYHPTIFSLKKNSEHKLLLQQFGLSPKLQIIVYAFLEINKMSFYIFVFLHIFPSKNLEFKHICHYVNIH